LLKYISYFFIGVGSLISLICFYEFYSVKMNSAGYPWGLVNDNPWYYETANTYINYNLTNSILFLALSILLAIGQKKDKKLLIWISIILLIILCLFK
jgi:hypothetical protein